MEIHCKWLFGVTALCLGLGVAAPVQAAGSDRLLAADMQEWLDRARAVVDDSVITGMVKAALLRDREVKSLGISVETNDGEVTLSGSVEDKRQAERAEKVAQDVDGVKKVTNKIRIQGDDAGKEEAG